MSEVLTLQASVRSGQGTGEARALRRAGRVPAIIYGAGKEPISVHVEEKEATKRYRKSYFKSTVIELDVDGKIYKVLPKEVDLHPITEVVRHIDFMFLDGKVKKFQIPLFFEGKERSIGIKRGGVFNVVKRRLPITCDSKDIPQYLPLDISSVYVGQSIKASQVKMPKGCELACKPDLVVASIIGRGGAKAAGEEGAEEA